jgi:hypothetical protein
LDMKWFVKPKRVAQLCSLDRSGSFAEHLLDRVTWNDMNQEKDQGKDKPERGESEQKAMENVAGHGGWAQLFRLPELDLGTATEAPVAADPATAEVSAALVGSN